MSISIHDAVTGSITTNQTFSDTRQLTAIGIPVTGTTNGTKDFVVKATSECGVFDQTGQKRTLVIQP